VVTGLSGSQEAGDDGDWYHGDKQYVLCADMLTAMRFAFNSILCSTSIPSRYR
jgi:hypothetical protein